MLWHLKEAAGYYSGEGTPDVPMKLLGLLKEIQRLNGIITRENLADASEASGLREDELAALIERTPGLLLEGPGKAEKSEKAGQAKKKHCLEICGRSACMKRGDLMAAVEKRYGKNPADFKVKVVGCMHACGKAPNIRWDGRQYRNADEKLIRRLVEESRNE